MGGPASGFRTNGWLTERCRRPSAGERPLAAAALTDGSTDASCTVESRVCAEATAPVIPADRWHDPYMPMADLRREIGDKTAQRNAGTGTMLLKHLEALDARPIFIGTWAAPDWAVRFYEKNGYRLLGREEASRLLRTYWSIPERQIETSVVLASPSFRPQSR